MNKVNYQRELEKIILKNEKNGVVPSLLLHSCCAPCSSWCLEYLTDYFQVTDFYYNPNITDAEEYERRERELMRLIVQQPHKYPVTFLHGDYEPKKFYEAVRGFENCREGGERCFICYELRLRETALQAKKGGYDYFTTTLTISPLKNAEKLNEIGEKVGEEIGVSFLPSDFKKRGGYLRSTQLSKEYGLYRQNYCGCVFSKRESCATMGDKVLEVR